MRTKPSLRLTLLSLFIYDQFSVQPNMLKALTVFSQSYQKRVFLVPDRDESQLSFDLDVCGSSLDEHSALTEREDGSAGRK